MAKVIAVSNQKGGVGKTTTVSSLAAGLVEKGYKVLVVDGDPQTNLSLISVGKEKNYKNTLLDVLNAAKDGTELSPDDVIFHSKSIGYDFIPGSLKLIDADLRYDCENREFLLKKALQPYLDLYDYIIIDTPPTLGFLVIASLCAADEVIIPANAELLSVQGFATLMKFIASIQQSVNPDLKVAGILITRYTGDRIRINSGFRNELKKFTTLYKTKLFEKPIREAAAIRENQMMKISIFRNKKAKVTEDYQAFVDEFLEGEKE